MADYYDISDNRYHRLLEYPYRSQRLRVEFLDHMENTLFRVEQDIDASGVGKIVNNNAQGTRRSFNFNLINLDGKYNLMNENTFWFNRKFRVYLGLAFNNGDNYWFTKGVFITQNANMDSRTKSVALSGVDKYAQLDGTLNVLQADVIDTIFEVGTKIKYVVKDILMMDIGNGFVLDPIEPIIDPIIGEQELYKEFKMSAGSYYGDFMAELMTSFGCDIFYDALGRLTIRRVFNDDRPYWFAFKSPAYHFRNEIWGYQSPQISFDLKGINKITVSSESTEHNNTSVTVINDNPRSPLCATKIGYRVYPNNGGIEYINLGDENIDTPETKCREYAEYRLCQETCLALSASFQCPPIYHLCEGDVIIITDDNLGFNQEAFLVNSIDVSAGTGNMSISATNLTYLPTDIYIDSRYTDLDINTTKYNVVYNLNGGAGVLPSSIYAKDGLPFRVSIAYDTVNNLDTVYNTDEKYEMTGWHGSDDVDYSFGSDMTIPSRDVVLYANWVDYSDHMMIVMYTNSTAKTSYVSSMIDYSQPVTIDSITVNDKKIYFKGRGYYDGSVTSKSGVSFPAGNNKIRYVSDSNHFYIGAPARLLRHLYNDCGATANIQVSFPNCMESLDFINYPLLGTFSEFVLPDNISSLSYDGSFIVGSGLTEFNFNTNNNLNITATSGGDLLSNNANLARVTASKDIQINNNGSSSMNVLNKCPIKTAAFDGNLQLNNTSFMTYASTTLPSGAEYNFGDISVRNTLAGAVTIFSDNMYSGNSNTNLKLTTGSLSAVAKMDCITTPGINLLSNIYLGSLTINGGINIQNACTTFNNIYLKQNANVTVNGDLTLIRPLVFSLSTNFSTFTINGDTTISTGLSSESTLSGNDMVFIGNSSMTSIVFNGDVTIDATHRKLLFIVSNSNLTDVYFYGNTTIRTTSSVEAPTMFQNNNANFKVHGYAGSEIETYCLNNGITFVEIE